jgi:hypothetical protein
MDDNTMPHNGRILKEFVEQSGLSPTKVFSRMNTDRNTLAGYYNSNSMQMRILWNASNAIQHNIIAEIGSRLSIPFATPKEIELQQKLETALKELELVQIELNVYKNIVRR